MNPLSRAQPSQRLTYVSTNPSGSCVNAAALEWNPVAGSLSGCISGTWTVIATSGIGIGSVTNFTAGTLSPLFTTSVATGSTTPALTFVISNATQNSVLAGPASGGTGAPSYQTAPTVSAANLTSFPK